MVGRAVYPAHKIVVIVRYGRVRSYIGTRYRRKAVDDGADEEAFIAGYRGGVRP